MKATFTLPLAFTLALAACKVGPNFRAPDTAAAGSQWKEGKAGPSHVPDAWWKLFRDAELNRLVARALGANNDLAAARSRVETARALTGMDRAKLFPRLDLTGSAGINRVSQDAIGQNLPPGITLDLESERYRSELKLAYELDLWGRNRRALEASRADADAQLELMDAQRLGVAGEVARQYFLLRALDAQTAVLNDTIASRKQALDLQKSRSDAGLTDASAATRARTELELASNDLTSVERQRGSAEHALAVLCGMRPADFSLSRRGGLGALPNVKPGVPAEVMLRRPDVRAAEQQLRAANARIGMAEAAFYPNFSLTASGGFEALDAKRFLDWENRVLALGTNLTAPIFDAGANKANLKAAHSRNDEALAKYRQSLLVALRETEDAMLDLKSLARSQRALEAARNSAQETRKLASERFDKGLSNYLEVIDADRSVLQTRLALAQIEGQQRIAMVSLIRAMGGGWEGK